MKISSASKKVLASALSAAMVVAFAPTVAFGASTVVATNTYYDDATGAEKTVDYYDADKAFAAAIAPEALNTSAGNGVAATTYDAAKAAIALAGDTTLTQAIVDNGTLTKVAVDLAGHTLTSGKATTDPALVHSSGLVLVGEGTLKDGAPAAKASSFATKGITVGTDKIASKVTFAGVSNGDASSITNFGEITVVEGSSIELGTGHYKIHDDADTLAAFNDAVNIAYGAGAKLTVKSSGAAGFSTYDGTVALAGNDEVKVAASNVSLNGTTYTDIASALNVGAGTADAPVTLLADLDENTGTINSAGHINLNGHTIDRAAFGSAATDVTLYGTGKLTGMTADAAAKITIADGANITIENSAARKNEKADKKSELKGTITVKGTLNIADTTSASNAAITVIDGTVNTKAGYFGDFLLSSGYAVIDGGAFGKLSNTAGELTVSKATYVDSAGKELSKKAIADGSVLDIKAKDGGTSTYTYEVGAPVATAQVTRTAEDGKTKFEEAVKCASLQGAVYAASNKTTVTLDADVEGVQTLVTEVADNVTVDLGGHTVKGGLNTTGKLTVKNGNVIGYGEYAVEAADANTVIESGTYTAEPKTVNGVKTNPKGLVKSGTITGGTFKNATYAVTNAQIKGGTFDKKVTPYDGYSIAENADGTFTVSLGGVACGSFGAVNGVIKKSPAGSDVKFTIADKDKALEKAVEAAYSKVLTAAWAADPTATELAGFKFEQKDPASTTDTTTWCVKSLTKNATDVKFVLDIVPVALEKTTLVADKDYSVVSAYKVVVKVVSNGGTAEGVDNNDVIGYLTDIAVDLTYEYTQTDTANYTYGFLGDEKATYDAEKKLYTFSTATSKEFGVERISNSIIELQEQMKQIEIAAQDKAAANTIKGTAKTIKTKKGVTAKKYTVKVKPVTSESGAVATFKKANTAGKSKITVAKSGTITVKKGLKKGTYKVKVKGTVGASSKTVYAKIVIK